jgi:hypothetical protein
VKMQMLRQRDGEIDAASEMLGSPTREYPLR